MIVYFELRLDRNQNSWGEVLNKFLKNLLHPKKTHSLAQGQDLKLLIKNLKFEEAEVLKYQNTVKFSHHNTWSIHKKIIFPIRLFCEEINLSSTETVSDHRKQKVVQ